MKLRDKRESQALKFLMMKGKATAIDLASAAMTGETGQRHTKALNNLGIKLGLHFVKRGFATIDRFNRFEWVPK